MPRKPKEPDILRTAKQVVALLAKSGLVVGDQYRVVNVVEAALPSQFPPVIAGESEVPQ